MNKFQVEKFSSEEAIKNAAGLEKALTKVIDDIFENEDEFYDEFIEINVRGQKFKMLLTADLYDAMTRECEEVIEIESKCRNTGA